MNSYVVEINNKKVNNPAQLSFQSLAGQLKFIRLAYAIDVNVFIIKSSLLIYNLSDLNKILSG